MSPENFAYWLQGYFELTEKDKGLSPSQCEIIREHLKLVFKKETPNILLNDIKEYKLPEDTILCSSPPWTIADIPHGVSC